MSKTDVISPTWAKELNKMRQSESKVADISLRDNSLVDMADMAGWTILKRYIQDRKRELKDSLRNGMKEDNFELIGQKAIIVDIIEEEFESLVNLVENTRAEVKKQEAKNAVQKSKK